MVLGDPIDPRVAVTNNSGLRSTISEIWSKTCRFWVCKHVEPLSSVPNCDSRENRSKVQCDWYVKKNNKCWEWNKAHKSSGTLTQVVESKLSLFNSNLDFWPQDHCIEIVNVINPCCAKIYFNFRLNSSSQWAEHTLWFRVSHVASWSSLRKLQSDSANSINQWESFKSNLLCTPCSDFSTFECTPIGFASLRCVKSRWPMTECQYHFCSFSLSRFIPFQTSNSRSLTVCASAL